jgi:lysophospholipase L1-like esterase
MLLLLSLACAPPDSLDIPVSAKVDPGWACASTPCTVMPLGDSITDGYNVPGGYRIELEDLIEADGADVDFVGSLSNGPADLDDHDHEGHSGWRIDQIQGIIRPRMATYDPDVVLLHIGTNDIAQNYQVARAPARLRRLVQTIVDMSPDTLVAVASIIPISTAIYERKVVAYNAQIPDIVDDISAAGGNVIYVDMHSELTTADLADGVHPNEGGYDKMGDAWYDAIAPYVE